MLNSRRVFCSIINSADFISHPTDSIGPARRGSKRACKSSLWKRLCVRAILGSSANHNLLLAGASQEAEGGKRKVISMEIYKIATVEEAAEWISGFKDGRSGMACLVKNYQLGDEAYLLDCLDEPRNTVSIRSSIKYRKGKFIVGVSGGSQDIVERFAKYALEALPAS